MDNKERQWSEIKCRITEKGTPGTSNINDTGRGRRIYYRPTQLATPNTLRYVTSNAKLDATTRAAILLAAKNRPREEEAEYFANGIIKECTLKPGSTDPNGVLICKEWWMDQLYQFVVINKNFALIPVHPKSIHTLFCDPKAEDPVHQELGKVLNEYLQGLIHVLKNHTNDLHSFILPVGEFDGLHICRPSNRGPERKDQRTN